MKSATSRVWLEWSETKLRLLEQCPLAFKFCYIDRQRVPQGAKKVFGAALHYLFKRFFQVKFQSLESFTNAGIHFWSGVVQGRHGPSSFVEKPIKIRWRKSPHEDYYGLLREVLRVFYEQNEGYKSGILPSPTYLEAPFRFRHHGLVFLAKIDRIQPLDENDDIIIDYKTGLSQRSNIELSHDLQFTVYSLAYRKRFGRPPAKMALYFVNPQASFSTIVPARQDSHFVELGGKVEEAFRFVHGALLPPEKTCLVAQQNYHYFCFPPMPCPNFFRNVGTHCQWCDYDFLCIEHKTDDCVRQQQILRELENIQPQVQVKQLNLDLKFKRPRKRRVV